MKEKEIIIIEAGIKLFAKKGFSSTTIQEIAEECGISKGSFYLHFKSKEALLLSTFEYYLNFSMENLNKIRLKHDDPREAFIEQTAYQFKEIFDHRDFIVMMIREHTIPTRRSMSDFFQRATKFSNEFYLNALSDIYRSKIDVFKYDLNMIVQGMITSYKNLFLFSNITLDFTKLAEFILERMDDIVEGLTRSNKAPVLTEQAVFDGLFFPASSQDHILKEIKRLSSAENIIEDHLITLQVLEEEMKKDEPRKPVLQGMLANIQGDEEFDSLVQLIKDVYKLE
ncbi:MULTISPECIES: TetR/AcrR family transcriptional regulator [Bacillus]|uniref:HTH tetR-type domain-containing protein n=2 Tax=Bacillus TaxID=1386 RepID=A0A0M4G120_9BACI|nr:MULTISPECIES: TetR/AcrR family transcriptional regulator [Bacillus]ALC83925.1 hypothetical protein AM592_22300 [Bacillus gobiensis]MBP1083011.1 AcrR family transcriptional regulator [Bacillus capparidis]MED1098016.1 helix-turn-helix domain containing protein [Bacillus capparidis]